MKVLDIIQEDRASGFINTFLKGIAWAFGRGARAKAVEELTEAWLRKMMEAGTTRVSMPVNVIRDPALAADRSVMDDAYKAAVKGFRKAEREGLIRDIAAGARASKESIAWALGWVKRIFITAAYLGSMFHASSLIKEYKDQADDLDRELQNGEIDINTHHDEIGRLRLRLIGELGLAFGAALAANSAILRGATVLSAKAGSFMIRLLTFNIWKNALSPVASLYTTATAGAQYYFVYKLSVDTVAREQLMDLILSDSVVMNNAVWLASPRDVSSHPFIVWAKKIFSDAEEEDKKPEPSARPAAQQSNRPRPAKPGDPEDISDIDWSKQR